MGLGRKIFTRERLTAADVNGYLMDQTIMVFASAAARDTAVPAPALGMRCYLLDRAYYLSYGPNPVGGGYGWQYEGGQRPAPDFGVITPLAGWNAVAGRTLVWYRNGDGEIVLEGAFSNANAFTPPASAAFNLPVQPSRLYNFASAASTTPSGAYNLELPAGGVGALVRGPGSLIAAGTVFAVDGVRYRPLWAA